MLLQTIWIFGCLVIDSCHTPLKSARIHVYVLYGQGCVESGLPHQTVLSSSLFFGGGMDRGCLRNKQLLSRTAAEHAGRCCFTPVSPTLISLTLTSWQMQLFTLVPQGLPSTVLQAQSLMCPSTLQVREVPASPPT